MSKGAGRVQRSIEAAFTGRPDDAHTTEDLIAGAYPGLDRIEKKHRVAVLRAARSICKRLPEWEVWHRASVVFVNRASVMSYAVGRLKADNSSQYRINGTGPGRLALAGKIQERLAPGGEDYHRVVKDGAWWRHTEQWKTDNGGHKSPPSAAPRDEGFKRRRQIIRVRSRPISIRSGSKLI
jgi:hypothetical protein